MAKPKGANQTQFSEYQPLYEEEYRPPAPKVEKDGTDKPLYKQRRFIIGAALGFVLLLLLLAVIFSGNGQMTPEEVTPEEMTQEEQAELTDYQQRINNLKQELEAADSTKQDLAFPPINPEINLEDN